MKTIRDPVHGDMRFTREEMMMIDTPQFQRMRGIRQLGTSNLVFPGAVHSRFDHSLGTCFMVKRMTAFINQRAKTAGMPDPIDEDLARLIAAAALLHDITHIPFGHTFEDERRILPAHDDSSERLRFFLEQGALGDVLAQLGLQQDLVRFFLEGEKQAHPFAYQLVAGPICSDLLDYLKRDAFFTGLQLAYDDRLLNYLHLEQNQLCFDLYSENGFRQDAWSELVNLLRIRYSLTERVYFHHTKMVSGAMLSRLLEVLLEKGRIEVEELYHLRDDSFLYILEQRVRKIRPYRPLLDCFLARKLYKRVYMVAKNPLDLSHPAPEYMTRFQNEFHRNQNGARAELEKRLARHLNIPTSAIILYAPDIHMRLKAARVMVRVSAGPLKSLGDFKHPELEALNNRHQALWKFYLFMSPQYEHLFVKAGKFLEREIGLPNQLALFNRGQLTLGF
ncbi:HD domain-containing protein [Acanthopleuribacter pedis]|uniref:HD domain-containing protein n=1 Tax=Acanthopleuribacter pedis TaxID=442870 RepID=A0A8J7Q0F9_9BACT|nr:HD domain-containing protein [Acanthopleuribacter pedis]MBO1316989.1 HD domain-containing protein [Acanthopleuribacter pedis]